MSGNEDLYDEIRNNIAGMKTNSEILKRYYPVAGALIQTASELMSKAVASMVEQDEKSEAK